MTSTTIKLYNKALGREEDTQVTARTTIAELRAQAGALFHLPASELQLFWKGGELIIAHIAQLQPGDTIQVNQRQEGDVPESTPQEPTHNTVLVQMPNGTTKTMHVTPTETVDSLIARLEVTKRPDQRCQLIHEAEILEGHKSFRELDLPDRTSLLLEVKLIGGIFT